MAPILRPHRGLRFDDHEKTFCLLCALVRGLNCRTIRGVEDVMRKLHFEPWRRSALLLLLLLLAISYSPSPARSQQPAALVIEGGTLIDGNGGAPLRDSVVVIEGSKITNVSRKGQVSYPANALIIKADGKYVLPDSSILRIPTVGISVRECSTTALRPPLTWGRLERRPCPTGRPFSIGRRGAHGRLP